jgi:hypothetical protein
MTSCQRPKECEPSRYRHGSDPPKQVDTASLYTLVERFLCLTQSSVDPFTYIRSKVTESQARMVLAPSRRRCLPCHRL